MFYVMSSASKQPIAMFIKHTNTNTYTYTNTYKHIHIHIHTICTV